MNRRAWLLPIGAALASSLFSLGRLASGRAPAYRSPYSLKFRHPLADLEVGFNVNYLLDALAAIDGAQVEIGLSDSNSSCLIRSPGSTDSRYVVMPMRL